MIPEAREVHLSRKDRKVLEACCRSPVTLQRDLKRARETSVVKKKAQPIEISHARPKKESNWNWLDFG
jgi:hypothetical protein